MGHSTSRRFFLGAATAAAASRVWGANERINVAIVGLGGRGSNHLNIYSHLAESRVVALCDIDQAAREKAQATLARGGFEKAKEFEDLRQAYADPAVEAVSIATPNHWHALAAILAMKAGKDVYSEKPACYNIHEGQKMIEVSRETKKMLQIGSQHRSTPFKMKAIAALQQGLIGNIYMAKGLCFKRRASIGHAENSGVPPGVNWDLFLGPAPMRPFNKLRFKYNWHWFWDTGNGDIGNQGVHEIGICRWGLGDPEWPKTAYAHGGKYAYTDDQETPNTLLASYDYGGRELVFEVRGLLTGGEGSKVQRRPGPPATGAVAPPESPAPAATAPINAPPLNIMIGNLFYGTEGWAAMSDQGFQAFKGESNELIMEEHPDRTQRADATGLHMQNFLAACKSRNYKDLHDEIGNAYLSASLCHLANISYRTGHKLTLAAGPKFVNDGEANKMLTRDYRKPFVV
ncbi:MAG TPA: Gfo/Idh/MocA family oxidoreductase [Candidatus Sulfopaludibacter sp.]|nr:Gfo/Idh/MocA family oxidoreductase [Candidatus Sulfopaludibacter sp.]